EPPAPAGRARAAGDDGDDQHGRRGDVRGLPERAADPGAGVGALRAGAGAGGAAGRWGLAGGVHGRDAAARALPRLGAAHGRGRRVRATPTVALTRQQAEDFLYHEARLLDERRFEEWLELFTADGLYWLPMDDGTDPTLEPSILFADANE